MNIQTSSAEMCRLRFQFASQYGWNFSPIGMCGWYLAVFIQALVEIDGEDDDDRSDAEKQNLVMKQCSKTSTHHVTDIQTK